MATGYKLDWNGPRVWTAVETASHEWGKSCGDILKQAIENNIQAQGLIDTGFLQISWIVDVGVLDTEIKSFAEYAAVHEYGSTIKNIPARPYLRPAVEDNRGRLLDEFYRNYRAQS
jgi:phage gpG-like protein